MKYALKIAIRNLKKGKLYTFIHVFGLTLGMTACLLIGTVVIDELSYDKQWSRSADTYRLLSIREGSGAHSQKGGTVYAGLAPALKQYFPEMEDRSEEHTSELQSLMRISYAVFCLKKTKNNM